MRTELEREVDAGDDAPVSVTAVAAGSWDLYRVKLDVFEGPLDLLLHLIKKNEVEIVDIPIATITEQYLAYLDMMRELNLDIAGEFLVMAATLTLIKSRMLLPPSEDEEDDEEADPRAELVQQLLEYQRYREAALALAERPLLHRDVFVREPRRWTRRRTPAAGELPRLQGDGVGAARSLPRRPQARAAGIGPRGASPSASRCATACARCCTP